MSLRSGDRSSGKGLSTSSVGRFIALQVPDWPIVSWGVPLSEPAAVFVANRVVATSSAARAEGVRIGQRRRDAQSRCSDLAILDRDQDREARLFEPVAAALVEITPRVEISGSGLVAFPTKGPSRFFGGDQPLVAKVLDQVTPVLDGRGVANVGVADSLFAARLAAKAAGSSTSTVPFLVVPSGETPMFLAPLPITALEGVESIELTEVLIRLGLTTLGDFAALHTSDVIGRFGTEGLIAHRLARGLDQFPPDLRRPVPDLSETWWFDPPAERIDPCAFAAKALADALHEALGKQGLACVRVAIEAETEKGEEFVRLWRHEGALSAAALAERARWQLDGWLHQARINATDPDEGVGSGIARLTLIPDEVVAATGKQLGFWGGRAERADDVSRVVARIQGMLGAEAVRVPEWRGGRGPGEQITLIPAAAVDLGEPRAAAEPSWVTEPWPGKIPDPAPAFLWPEPPAVEVRDHAGDLAEVSGRGELSGEPALVTMGGRIHAVTGWAGPWPADEHWWDPLRHRRRARLQVTLDDHSAHLLMVENRAWHIEATY